MKKLMNYFMIVMFLMAVTITGCKDDTNDNPEPQTSDFSDLSSYMADNGMDLPDLLASWVIAPTLVADGGIVDADAGYTIPNYYVFDIRSESDFNAGHIKGSMNVALADVITKANEVGKDKPILVVCYTGQTASRAVMALRLSGFTDAKVMKFGFSYWTNDTYDGGAKSFDKWTPNVSDVAVGDANWVTTASPSLPSNGYPEWTSTETDMATLLSERVDDMLANTSWMTSSSNVLNAPSNYKIYNYWAEADYLGFGHYSGAYQYLPISIANDVLKALPTSDECQIYCYTGQTSAFATAWLQVLGYNAKSIGFGVNSLSHTALETDKPTVAWHESHDYEYETSK